MKPIFVPGIGDHFKHTLGIDRFGAPGVDHPPLPHRFEQGTQILFAVQRQEDIGIKVHENNGHRLAMPADTSLALFQFMRRHQGAGKSVNGIYMSYEIYIFNNIF